MNAIKGEYRNGQIILTETANWPDGTEVLVEPIDYSRSVDPVKDDWPTDPESIAQWIAEFEAIPPLQMTIEEEAAWQTARQARKEFEIARWETHAKDIEGLFP